jgi:hypothetical protein
MMRDTSHAKRQLSHVLAALGGILISWSCRSAEPAPPAEAKVEVAPRAEGQPNVGEAPACGGQGQAECPTQHWMKATLQAYLRTKDYKRLEASFNDLASHGPADFDRWQSLAKSGASAAANQDEALVRKSCQDCHDSYRAEFRKKYRSVVFL